MSLRAEDVLTPAQIQALLVTRGITVPAHPKKRHKYGAKQVTVDGIIFPSMLEARCYTMLKIQWQAGLITEPLRQVSFSLGEHYGKEKFYRADFVFVDVKSGRLIVADAKGKETKEYLQKRDQFARVYGFCIKEYRARDL